MMNRSKYYSWIPLLLMCLSSSLYATADVRVGKVLQRLDVDNYTYLEIEERDEINWLAIPSAKVMEGDQVQFSGGTEMGSFYSKQLDRTFDNIVFLTGVKIITSGHADIAESHPGFKIGKPTTAVAPRAGEIKPLDGGMVIAGILAEKLDLEGQIVRLRAKVIKVNQNIMGKNWIVLADGSRHELKDTLMATSDGLPRVGEILIVQGRIRNNVSLGSGYDYAVILEEASFERTALAN